MYRKPSYWTVLLFSALVVCTVHGQDDQDFVDQMVKEYLEDKALKKDPNLNFNLLKLAKQLETTRTSLLVQDLTDDAYWDEVDKAVTATIDNELNSPNPVLKSMEKFFKEHIASLKARGQAKKNNNNALVLLIAAVHKANDLDIDWQNKLRGTIPPAPARGAGASGSAAAAQGGVPDWYTAMTEHKKQRREYRAKVREWRRSVHRRY